MTSLLFTVPLGLLMGILVNYLCDVLPLTRKIGKPICTRCQTSLSWKEYLFSTRCSACTKVYPARRYFVLVLFPILVSLLWIFPPERFNVWLGLLLITYAAVIFIVDVEYRAILLPTIWVGIAIFFILGISTHGFLPTILGGAAGFLIMLSLHYAGHLYTQWLAKRRGEVLDEPALGLGDVNLSGVLGLGLGWPGIIAGLVIAIFLGGLISLVYLVVSKVTRNYKLFQAIPYAPFLILAALYLLFR